MVRLGLETDDEQPLLDFVAILLHSSLKSLTVKKWKMDLKYYNCKLPGVDGYVGFNRATA